MDSAFCVYDRLHELDPAAFSAVAPEIRAITGGGESRVTADLLDQLPALELIAVMGVGYDGIDVIAAKKRGIRVTHTPDVLNDEVADLAIGLMLSAARQLPAADRWVRDGSWSTKGPMPLTRKLSGARLGIVGMGRIGKAIAQRAEAFQMHIAYTARSAKPDLPWPFVSEVKALAAKSDFLVVITPGGAETRHLVNAEVLDALGPKGILVNVARGSVVDEVALIEALESGRLGGAALDVFESEPIVPERLMRLPHVVLAPHIGSATKETRQAMADLTFANLREHFAGRPLISPVPECRD
ncbi:MAG: 2-hydroxyacid dehydrogenase [Verrucomicrobiota bacterium]